MKTMAAMLILFAVLALAGLPTLSQKDDPGFVRVAPEQVQWVDEPNGLGFQRAVIEGDPAKPGLYVVRVKFPPWVMSTNHYHQEDRYDVVLKGTWYTGTGDEFAPDKTVPLKPGSYMKHSAGAHHFDGAKDEEVIVLITGEGPGTSTQVEIAAQ